MAPSATNTSQAQFGEPLRVLLVAGHEHVLWGLSKLIEGEWPRMLLSSTARTVPEALAALEGRGIDVVVLDSLLEVSGAPQVPPAAALAGAALVVLAGEHDARLQHEASKAGAIAVVLKHEPAEVLLRQIERAHRDRHAVSA